MSKKRMTFKGLLVGVLEDPDNRKHRVFQVRDAVDVERHKHVFPGLTIIHDVPELGTGLTIEEPVYFEASVFNLFDRDNLVAGRNFRKEM